MRKIIKLIPILLVAAGIGLIAYPKVTEYVHMQEQRKLIEEWENSFRNLAVEQTELESEYEDVELPVLVDHLVQDQDGAEDETAKATRLSDTLPDHIEGMLYIEDIELSLPILRGATAANLNKSVASIANTGQPGQIGNYGIAGHRNHTYGRNFNRLEEMEVGDVVEVDNGLEIFTYKVTETLLVEPDEVWVLEGNDTDRMITLVTCHPLVNPTHRLIVQGVMEP